MSVSRSFVWLVALGTSIVVSTASAQSPRLDAVLPLGARAGASVEVTLSGAGLSDVQTLLFSRPQITVKKTGPDRFTVSAAAEAPLGDCDVWAVTERGLSNPRRFCVSAADESIEKEKNDEIATAQQIGCPGAVSGRLLSGTDLDHFRFTGIKGSSVTLRCRSETLDGSVRPALTVLSTDGKELAHADRGVGDVELSLSAPDTECVVRVFDRGYQADASSHYRIELSTGPRLKAVFPSTLTIGQSRPATLFGERLPEPAPGRPFVIEAPPSGDLDGGGWTLSSAATLDAFRYRETLMDGSVRLALSPSAVTLEQSSPHDSPEAAQRIEAPGDLAGMFLERSELDWYRFTAKKGQRFWIEAFGERLGSAMDLDLAIHDDKGRAIVSFTDTVTPKGWPAGFPLSTLDPSGNWLVPADGEYHLLVRDLYGGLFAGPDRAYRVVVQPRLEEAFVFAIHPDDKLPQGLTIPRGGRSAIQLLALRRGGHQGAINVRAEDLPPGLSADETWIGPEESTALLTVAAEKSAADWAGFLRLAAKTSLERKESTLVVRPVAMLRPAAAPKSAVVRRTAGLAAAIRGAAPLTLTALPTKSDVTAGGSASIPITIASQAKLKGAVKVVCTALPSTMTAKEIAIAEGKSTGDFRVAVSAKALPGRYTIVLQASAQLLADKPAAKEKKSKSPSPSALLVWSNAISLEVVSGETKAPKKTK